ncbi:MAG: hypothetical protein KJ950_00820 [Proteobacteria bacterium]|nr:hypothetical protein [Pseudomonadota bacterium]
MKITDGSGADLTSNKVIDSLRNKKINIRLKTEHSILGIKGRKQLAKLFDVVSEFLQNKKINPGHIKGMIEIVFDPHTKSFDPTVAAWGILFSGLLTKVTFRFSFPHGDVGKSPALYRLSQILLPHLVLKKTNIELRSYDIGRPGKLFSWQNFLRQHLRVSSAYLPPINLNNKNYVFYFDNNARVIWNSLFNASEIAKLLEKNVPHKSTSSSKDKDIGKLIFNIIRERLLDELFDNGEVNYERIVNVLLVLYMAKAITLLKCWIVVLDKYISEGSNARLYRYVSGKSSKVGSLKYNEKLEYYKKNKEILSQVFDSSPFSVFLFSFFLINNYSPNMYSGDPDHQLDKLLSQIKSIRNVSVEIYSGVYELAKNIVEHVPEGNGFIIGRVFTADYLKEIYSEEYEDFRTYINSFQGDQQFFNCVVFDNGKKGILYKTQSKITKLIPSVQNKILKKHLSDELECFNNQTLGLHDFFDLKHVRMFHQKIRTAASLGLLMLTNMLRINNGFLSVSSVDKHGTQGIVYYGNETKSLQGEWWANIGTQFELFVPVSAKKPLELRARQYRPVEPIIAGDAYEGLLNYCTIDEKDEIHSSCNICDPHVLCLHNSSTTNVHWESFHLEHAKLFNKISSSKCNDHHRKVFTIKIEDNNNFIDASDLFRLLAQLQIEVGYNAVVIYNLKEETLHTFFEIFRIYGELLGMDVWSGHQTALFYYVPQSSSSHKKFSAFLVTGRTLRDLVNSNETIHSHSPGDPIWNDFFPMTQKSGEDEDLMEKQIDNPLVIDGKYLIPLDLVLKVDGLSLFEWNMRTNLLDELLGGDL